MAYEQARTFLAKVVSWPAEGENGFINVHWRDQDKQGNIAWSGRACRTLDDAISNINWILSKNGKHNLYVCMSRQSKTEVKTAASGWQYNKIVRSLENAMLLKAFWFDIDYKDFSSPDDVYPAVRQFLEATKLPGPNVLVKSGGGIQIFWTLAFAIEPIIFLPIAHAFANAAQIHGLKADIACTSDAARILRIPNDNIFNYKYDPPRPVTLEYYGHDDFSLERISELMLPYKVTTPLPLKPNAPISDLSAGIERPKARLLKIKDVALECAFIREAVMTGGKAFTQPMWHLTTLAATFMERGREVAHIMGKDHPGYSTESTDELFDRKEREKTTKNIGWPTCKAFTATKSQLCAGCPHFSKGQSPLNHARKTSPQVTLQVNGVYNVTTQSNIMLPAHYHQTTSFTIEKEIINDDGSAGAKIVTPWPVYNGWLSYNDKQEMMLYFDSQLAHQIKTFLLPCEHINSAERSLRKLLQRQGLEVPDLKGTGEFFMAWFTQLKQQLANSSLKPFGWNIDEHGHAKGFAYGGHLWNGGGSVPVVPGDIDAKAYSPIGRIEPWKEAAKLITDQHRPELEVIFASSFAAPLVQFSLHQGWMLSAYSTESGLGKTSAMMVGCAVWGNTVRSIQSQQDTVNALNNKMARLSNLPMFWDEGGLEQDDIVKFLLQLTSGKEKDRLGQNAEARETQTWATMLTVTSNRSVIDVLTSKSNISTAPIYRVFEFPVRPPYNDMGQLSDTRASNILDKLKSNYGQAGLVYAKFLGANAKQIEDEMLACMEDTEKELHTTSSERFWLANHACITLGAKYANTIGLTSFNLDEINDFMLQTFENMRGHSKEIRNFSTSFDIAQLIGNFIAIMGKRYIIKTDVINKKRGRSVGGNIAIIGDYPSEIPFIHIAVRDDILRLNLDRFEEWLNSNSSPYRGNTTAIIKDMLKHPGVSKLPTLTAIGGGVLANSPQVKVLEIEMSKIPELKDIDDTLSEQQVAASIANNVIALR